MGRAAAGRVTVSHFLLRSPPALRVAVVEDSMARAPRLHGQALLLVTVLQVTEELGPSALVSREARPTAPVNGVYPHLPGIYLPEIYLLGIYLHELCLAPVPDDPPAEPCLRRSQASHSPFLR